MIREIPKDLVFEDTPVGKLEREIWTASDEKIDKILKEFRIPSSPELAKPGTYIQTTPGYKVFEEVKQCDVVLIPIGSTEFHGNHLPSGTDTLYVTQICEAVRRHMKKKGKPVAITWPITYGSHPWHHYGMPGTVIIEEKHLKEYIMDVMLGLWNMGYRKQILINNHGHFWVLESAIQEFIKKYQLPGMYIAIDWHRAAGKFFRTKEKGGEFETDFVHADEAETSLALLLFPEEMVDMSKAVDTNPRSYLPDGHFDKAVDGLLRPMRWSSAEGHMPIEIFNTPEGVVGKATLADAKKAKRPIAFILKYLELLIDQILEKFPPGVVPPVEEITFRTREEMEPYLKLPGDEGWKPVYGLVKRLGGKD
ncbi:creatininase family protein [Thermococcus sp. MV5]|uniref:3-dehydro-scyllo-inosose hydrolase n=1 Tax=Thermococcus sp. MV5 TaxID=1638272 RepID=UPI0014396659|nr:3-dehydro-scyllo-inosose hydrolase [Thermococcus sp. MV5]NJE26127.1 creatininase family protein [Thermococcus sp. MV5]